MSIFALYLLTVLWNSAELFGIFGAVAIVSWVCGASVSLGLAADGAEDPNHYSHAPWKVATTVRKWALRVAVPCMLVVVLIPSPKDLVFIVGGNVVTNIEGVEELPQVLVDATRRALEAYEAEVVEEED